MVTIVYCKDGEAITINGCIDWMKRVITTVRENPKNIDMVFRVSTTVPLEYLRVMVHRGTLSHEEVQIGIDGKIFYLNIDGWCPHCPISLKEIATHTLEVIFTELEELDEASKGRRVHPLIHHVKETIHKRKK